MKACPVTISECQKVELFLVCAVQVETLDKEVVNAGLVAEALKDDLVKALHESDLRHVRCSELERCLHEVESQLSEANNRVVVAEKRVVCWEERGECLEKSLFQIRGQCEELGYRLENEEKRRLAMEDEGKKKELALHADLSEAQQQCKELSWMMWRRNGLNWRMG